MKDFSNEIKKIPKKPGVYLMKDKNQIIIYVGKAKNLKNRVSSYFQNQKSHSLKTKNLIKNIDNFEYIITDNEVEALILENNLIKKYNPRFNIRLKDDKTYPYIKITNENFPRILKVREVKKDGAKYFGPYTSDYDINYTINAINDNFMIRKSNRDLQKHYKRPCLNYYIKKCYAPCMQYISKDDYQKIIDEILMFLNHKSNKFLNVLEKKMQNAAKKEDFENAIIYRNQLESIKKLMIKQKITKNSNEMIDAIGIEKNKNFACISVFFIRKGILLGRENFIIVLNENECYKDIITDFLTQFYGGTSYIPKEILIEDEFDEKKDFENILSQKSKKTVKIIIPKIGEKKQLMKMIKTNAFDFLTKHIEKELKKIEKNNSNIEKIKEFLELKNLPKRIEIYDISNISGTHNVASMIVYENGMKKTNDYRRFKIKTVVNQNDFESMYEVLIRRFNNFLENKQQFSIKPNLIIIDGGKIHRKIAVNVLKELKINEIDVISLFKDDKHKTTGVSYYKGEKIFDRHSEIYPIFASMQDEVHRFAITYHRSLRNKNMIKSELDNIKGVGNKRKLELLKTFKSIQNIKKASFEEIKKVVGNNVAINIYEYFHKSNESILN